MQQRQCALHPKTNAAERDSCLKPRQSLTSGKVTHHISFRLSISGDAASFFCFFFFFSPQSLFSAPLGLSFFKRKVCGRSACVCYHRRETGALIQHGSKRAHNDTNQSLSKSLEGGIFAILETLTYIVWSLARKTHMSSVHRSSGMSVCAF